MFDDLDDDSGHVDEVIRDDDNNRNEDRIMDSDDNDEHDDVVDNSDDNNDILDPNADDNEENRYPIFNHVNDIFSLSFEAKVLDNFLVSPGGNLSRGEKFILEIIKTLKPRHT